MKINNISYDEFNTIDPLKSNSTTQFYLLQNVRKTLFNTYLKKNKEFWNNFI